MGLFDRADLLISDIFTHHARYAGGRAAIVCEDRRKTWAEVELGTRKVANALLARGLRKGDKVALFMHSSVLMFELMWGAVRAGAVVVPLNVMLAPDSLARTLNNSQAQVLFTDTENAATVRAAIEHGLALDSRQVMMAGEGEYASAQAFADGGSLDPIDAGIVPSDSMCIMYTSGTTGAPKGSEHTHLGRLIYYAYGFARWLRFDRYSVTLCATPLYANGTWMTMVPTMYSGGTIVVLPKFSPQAFYGAVERERCTHVFLVPTQMVGLLADPLCQTSDKQSLQVIYSAGQALLPAMYETLQRSFPQAGIYDCYGMSEGFGTICTPEDFARGKVGSVGKSILMDDIRILDEDGRELPQGQAGEIAGLSPAMMKGYYRDEERTLQALWRSPEGRTYLRSGDVGYFDADGYMYVCGRIKDMIKSGGIAVYASDIEAVFVQHPAVLEAAAIGIPHEKWLETPLLLARLRPGMHVTEQELADWGNERLGKFQRVIGVEFRDDFPRATYGKVQKAKLREPYWENKT
ncbi:MAG: AMP-binding protein [Pseudomonadota bacterium]